MATCIEGRQFTLQLNVTNDPTEFKASGLPKGLTLNRKDGQSSGIRAQNGEFEMALTIKNAFGDCRPTLIVEVKHSSFPGFLRDIVAVLSEIWRKLFNKQAFARKLFVLGGMVLLVLGAFVCSFNHTVYCVVGTITNPLCTLQAWFEVALLCWYRLCS